MNDATGLTPLDVVRATFSSSPLTRDENAVKDTFKRASAGGYLADIICLTDRRIFYPLEGTTFVGSIAIMIPRVLWKDKSISESTDMVAAMNANLSLPEQDAVGNPVMEGYINFLYPGVALVFVILGLVCRWLWAYRIKHQRSGAHLGLVLMALVPFFFFETHSTFGNFTLLRVPLLLILIVRVLSVSQQKFEAS